MWGWPFFTRRSNKLTLRSKPLPLSTRSSYCSTFGRSCLWSPADIRYKRLLSLWQSYILSHRWVRHNLLAKLINHVCVVSMYKIDTIFDLFLVSLPCRTSESTTHHVLDASPIMIRCFVEGSSAVNTCASKTSAASSTNTTPQPASASKAW